MTDNSRSNYRGEISNVIFASGGVTATLFPVYYLCRYDQSLAVLKQAKACKEGMVTKSSIMLGLGETDEEIKQTMADLRAIDVDILTLGQYLQVRCLAQFFEENVYRLYSLLFIVYTTLPPL